MLASMVDSPQPTRAEVSDVATAVLTGADTVMLATKQPTANILSEAVQLMRRIITLPKKQQLCIYC